MKKKVLIGIMIVTAVLFSAKPALGIKTYTITGLNMLPSLESGELVVIDERVYKDEPISRGDVVAFMDPRGSGRVFIERVVGLPGEIIEIRNGIVFIDEKQLTEDYVDSRRKERDISQKFPQMKVPQNMFFLLGDNRDNSVDSRLFGAVRMENIIGKMILSSEGD